jgi:hypothetical protein
MNLKLAAKAILTMASIRRGSTWHDSPSIGRALEEVRKVLEWRIGHKT